MHCLARVDKEREVSLVVTPFLFRWVRMLSGDLHRQAKALKSEDFGQLFSIQAFGSLTYRRDSSETPCVLAAWSMFQYPYLLPQRFLLCVAKSRTGIVIFTDST